MHRQFVLHDSSFLHRSTSDTLFRHRNSPASLTPCASTNAIHSRSIAAFRPNRLRFVGRRAALPTLTISTTRIRPQHTETRHAIACLTRCQHVQWSSPELRPCQRQRKDVVRRFLLEVADRPPLAPQGFEIIIIFLIVARHVAPAHRTVVALDSRLQHAALEQEPSTVFLLVLRLRCLHRMHIEHAACAITRSKPPGRLDARAPAIFRRLRFILRFFIFLRHRPRTSQTSLRFVDLRTHVPIQLVLTLLRRHLLVVTSSLFLCLARCMNACGVATALATKIAIHTPSTSPLPLWRRRIEGHPLHFSLGRLHIPSWHRQRV